MPISDARKKANQKWDEGNKERKNYLSWRSRAKSFITKAATEEDLKALRQMIDERLK